MCGLKLPLTKKKRLSFFKGIEGAFFIQAVKFKALSERFA
jgi:hypothetical protein